MSAEALAPCLVLPHAIAEGPANMATDEAMLFEAARPGAPALLRTYGWGEPTLSLGYFQATAEAEADPRWRGRRGSVGRRAVGRSGTTPR